MEGTINFCANSMHRMGVYTIEILHYKKRIKNPQSLSLHKYNHCLNAHLVQSTKQFFVLKNYLNICLKKKYVYLHY